MGFLDKMERKIGRHPIHNLMRYIVACYVIGYVLRYAFPQTIQYITLEPYYILHGQIWRIVSWLLIPPGTGIIWAVIMIIFYYQLGTMLERTWGSFRFNVYVFGGMIFTVIGAFLLYFIMGGNILLNTTSAGMISTYYINMSIFLAFAVCYPEEQVMLYFLIPVKMKWLAIFYVVVEVYEIVVSPWPARVSIIMALLNFLIFYLMTRRSRGRSFSPKEFKRRSEYKKQVKQPHGYRQSDGRVAKHKCAVCGRTELDDPNLEFRFCSKCNGNYEYCQDHLFTHKHIK